MLRHRRAAADADVVHYQWLTAPALDAWLLPNGPARVLTTHGFLRAAESGPSAKRALEQTDAVISLTEYGAERLRAETDIDPARIHVIPHGAFDYLTRLPEERPLPPELEGPERPVILIFGVIRPYKGTDVLLEAFAEIEDAELWIVGRPLATDVAELQRLAKAAPGRVRFVTRYVPDSEVPAIMRRADIVVLPYRDADQSGVLYTALAFGKPIVASAVGGFPETLAAQARGGWSRRATPLRSRRRSATSPAARAARAPRRRGPRGGERPILVGRGRPPHPRSLSQLPRLDNRSMLALEIAFWACAALIVHTHVTYPLSLALLVRLRRSRDGPPPGGGRTADRLADRRRPRRGGGDRAPGRNALESDYPRERLEVIVASDGSEDRTAELARAQAPTSSSTSAAAARSRRRTRRSSAGAGRSSPSRTRTRSGAGCAAALVERLADPDVGYVCGQVSFTDERGENQEGAYWRYEMAVRGLESGLASVTAGNGAIYAVRARRLRRDAVRPGPRPLPPVPDGGKGLRAVYEPAAVAEEPMAPTMSGEWERKRRMMNRTWGVLLHDRMLSPRGYGPLYAYEMLSHRALRYASPFLHLIALGANVALLGEGTVYAITLGLQAALLIAAALGRVIPVWPLRIAAYYVSVTASIAAGLIDRIRSGPATTWEPVEGTR